MRQWRNGQIAHWQTWRKDCYCFVAKTQKTHMEVDSSILRGTGRFSNPSNEVYEIKAPILAQKVDSLMIFVFAGLVGAERAINQVEWSQPPHTHTRTHAWAQTARHLSGVGTSRSALLLTVRVESGIARTKSNNGPRSWLGSSLQMLWMLPDPRITSRRLTRGFTAHLPASVWPPTVVWLVEGGVVGGGVDGILWQARPSPASL